MKFSASESHFWLAFCVLWEHSLLKIPVTKYFVCYEDFILKDTKLLSKPPWPSKKQYRVLLVPIQIQSFGFFNSFCKRWATGLRWFVLLKSTHEKFSKLFSQESLLCKTRHFVHPSVSLVKEDCLLHTLCSCQTHFHTWQKIFHWSGTWTVYTDSPGVDRRKKMYPIYVATPQFLQVA